MVRELPCGRLRPESLPTVPPESRARQDFEGEIPGLPNVAASARSTHGSDERLNAKRDDRTPSV